MQFIIDFMTHVSSGLSQWWASTSSEEVFWLTFGFSAQAMFFMRFLLQWIASERAQQSTVPEVFWYFSLAGGIGLFIYATYRMDPVIMVGQATGLLIYSRNIYFIWRSKLMLEKQSGKVAAE